LEGEPFVLTSEGGRLVRLQVFDLGVPEDVVVLSAALLVHLAQVEGLAVLIADHRVASPFSQEVGDAWSRAMRRFNPCLERSVVLLDRENETFNLQIARVVRCAGSPRRRWFYDASEAREWLTDVLTPAEAVRFDALVG
jgi:hypothetical protein